MIRLIHPNEWPLLAEVFRSEGGRLPRPERATAAVAFDDSGLAGFWTLQDALHAGPLWVRPDQRGTGLWRGLHACVDSVAGKEPGTGYYSFSGEPKVERIFTQLGYSELPYKLWKREY